MVPEHPPQRDEARRTARMVIARQVKPGIEIEVQVVRPAHIVAPRVPLVEVDAPEVHDPHERRQVLHHREIDDVAGSVADRADPDPLGARRGRPLHEEELAGRTVRVPLHDHRAIVHVWEQHCRDVGVVLKEVALRQPKLRPEDLPKVRQPDLAAVNGEDGVVLVAGNAQR